MAIPLILALLAGTVGSAPAALEWEVLKSLNTDARPIDVAVSADGKSVFVLTEDGFLAVYSPDGLLNEKMAIGRQAERIAVAPDGERLYVTYRQSRRVDVIQLDFVRDISLRSAPFKGPETAPVAIAVFSDFQ